MTEPAAENNERKHLSVLQTFLSRRPIRRAVRAGIERPAQSVVGLVLLTLVVGTIFYHLVEGWSLLDSVYFCVITLTTIGYGDFAPTTDFAKLFTIFYAFAGIGLLATFMQLRAAKRLQKGMVNKVEAGVSDVEHILHEEVLPHDPL